MSSEATGIELAAGVGMLGVSALLGFEPEPSLWHLDFGGSAFFCQPLMMLFCLWGDRSINLKRGNLGRFFPCPLNI